MSAYIEAIDGFAASRPNACAFVNSAGERITYGELKRLSDMLAAHLYAADASRKPVVVYGHKSPLMIACFLACAKSGRAYVPVDVMYPDLRIADIMDQLDKPLTLNTTARDLAVFAPHARACWDCSNTQAIEHLCAPANASETSTDLPALPVVDGDDTLYVLFTSGSTGRPKGVEVTAECMDNFWQWMLDEFGTKAAENAGKASELAADGACSQRVFFNRAPFSFDLSVTDLALGLGAGDTMFALTEEDEADLARTFEALRTSGTNFWTSTSSFADMCLRDPAFSPALLPQVDTFFFVGETLKNETAGKLLERFEGCTVVNGYGPTESTDLVTATSITQEMVNAPEALPVGYARPGTQLFIVDPETLEPLPTGEAGELFIVGDTVAKGYYGRPDLTEAAFHSCPEQLAQGRRSYRTGDKAVLDESGMLHFYGRLDFQVKLHGFRIELGEIEAALCRLEDIADACVLPVERKGSIAYLAACVTMTPQAQASNANADSSSRFDLTQRLKEQLRETLPEYMIPRKIVLFDQLPLNINNKVDRNRLRELI